MVRPTKRTLLLQEVENHPDEQSSTLLSVWRQHALDACTNALERGNESISDGKAYLVQSFKNDASTHMLQESFKAIPEEKFREAVQALQDGIRLGTPLNQLHEMLFYIAEEPNNLSGPLQISDNLQDIQIIQTRMAQGMVSMEAMRAVGVPEPYLNIDPQNPFNHVLVEYLMERNLTVKDVPGDGNCCFHSIAESYNAHFPDLEPLTHKRIRTDVCRFIAKKNLEWFHIAPEEPTETSEKTSAKQIVTRFVSRMRKPSVWGDTNCIKAAAHIYNVHINSWSGGFYPILFEPGDPKAPKPSNKPNGTLDIVYVGNSHYMALVPRDV